MTVADNVIQRIVKKNKKDKEIPATIERQRCQTRSLQTSVCHCSQTLVQQNKKMLLKVQEDE